MRERKRDQSTHAILQYMKREISKGVFLRNLTFVATYPLTVFEIKHQACLHFPDTAGTHNNLAMFGIFLRHSIIVL